MIIGSILTGKKPLISVGRDDTIAAIARLLYEHRIGAVIVVDGPDIVGIVSERDIVAALHVHESVLDCTASQVMTAPVRSAPPSTTVIGAMGIMTEYRIRHLPVVADGVCLGVVSIGDLVKQRIDDAEREASELKDYIQTS